MQVAILQVAFQTANGVENPGTTQSTDNADIAKLLHGIALRRM
jgi:hypothetical protein